MSGFDINALDAGVNGDDGRLCRPTDTVIVERSRPVDEAHRRDDDQRKDIQQLY